MSGTPNRYTTHREYAYCFMNIGLYTEACLLVANRPQAPVKPGAFAPGFLSRLRRLLLLAGREKSSPRLLLAVTVFLFFRHAQNPLHVVFGGE